MSERLTVGRLQAIAQSLHTVDPQTAVALATHADWLHAAEQALREANIQLATPELQTTTAQSLRDRIDALLGVVPRPINQQDED